MKNNLKNVCFAAAMAIVAQAGYAQSNATQTTQSQQAEISADLDAKYATELLKPGTMAPEIELRTLDGKEFRLSSLKGKYVVIDFWASWCPDCRKDAPAIIALYDKFKSKGVEFVGVSFDKNKESWQNGVGKLGIEYTQVSDLKHMRESAVAQAYHIKWIPSIYVVDPEGKVALSTVVSDKVSAYLHSVYPDCAE